MTTRSIRSYREASRYCGVPVTSLRDSIARGDVPAPVTGTDGKATFDVAALDALRAARMLAASARSVVTPSSVTVNAPTATPNASAPPDTTVPFAPWLAAAAAARDYESDRDRQEQEMDGGDDGDAETLQPFNGIPLGATRSATPTSAWPHSVTESFTSTSRVAELERQLADAVALRDHWYRAARIKAIADTIANEAMTMSLGDMNASQVSAHAAAHALGALAIEQLSIDSFAFSRARSAAHQALAWWTALQQQALQPRDPNDDLTRMRARRGDRLRSRSPR